MPKLETRSTCNAIVLSWPRNIPLLLVSTRHSRQAVLIAPGSLFPASMTTVASTSRARRAIPNFSTRLEKSLVFRHAYQKQHPILGYIHQAKRKEKLLTFGVRKAYPAYKSQKAISEQFSNKNSSRVSHR
jgi:hypothetical protein